MEVRCEDCDATLVTLCKAAGSAGRNGTCNTCSIDLFAYFMFVTPRCVPIRVPRQLEM